MAGPLLHRILSPDLAAAAAASADKGMSTGAKAGVGIGAVAVMAFTGLTIWLYLRHRRRKDEEANRRNPVAHVLQSVDMKYDPVVVTEQQEIGGGSVHEMEQDPKKVLELDEKKRDADDDREMEGDGHFANRKVSVDVREVEVSSPDFSELEGNGEEAGVVVLVSETTPDRGKVSLVDGSVKVEEDRGLEETSEGRGR